MRNLIFILFLLSISRIDAQLIIGSIDVKNLEKDKVDLNIEIINPTDSLVEFKYRLIPDAEFEGKIDVSYCVCYQCYAVNFDHCASSAIEGVNAKDTCRSSMKITTDEIDVNLHDLSFTLELFAAPSCDRTMSSKEIEIRLTSIRNEGLSEMKIYPNPSSGNVFIESKAELNSMSILSMSGQRLRSYDDNTKSLDISTFENGLYLLQVEFRNGDIGNALLVKN